jgi:hypothetical protein
MSHFVTMVIGRDPEIQLAGYSENDCHVFVDEEDDYRKKFNEDTIPAVVFSDGSRCTKYDKKVNKYWKRNGIGFSTQDEFIVPEGAKLVEIPAQEYYESFEEYMANWCGYRERDSLHKRYGSYQNPQAKWDWYEIGGRFDGRLILKAGIKDGDLIRNGKKEGTANVALFKHIDFDKTDAPFAVLKDGEWHERGNKERIDWESEYRSLLANIPGDTLISVYDCHT